jgi:phenylacetate-CoA ligase
MTAQDIWGMGELGAPAAECEHRTGLHFLGQGLVLPEFIDPVSGTVLPMTDGAVGELVFTTLEREAHPLIRFRSHDYVQISLGPCRCGRTGFRFRILGRSDDMFIVKGINVFPLAVQDVICGFRPELTGEFQILLDEAPPLTANPRLRVEVGAVTERDQPALQGRLAQRIREVLVFTADVELVPAGTLPRSEKKTKRLYRLYQGDQP